ncbi:hypothetical protein WA158_000114 [Blastocystis sp. Blastoise]
MSMSKTSRMLNLVNYRVKVILQENRTLVGTLMAFDKHMNLILGDCEEFRKIKNSNAALNGIIEEREEKKTLGLVLLRGETIISLQIEGPPPQEMSTQAALATPGQARAVGRGLTSGPVGAAPRGLNGPLKGLGGPTASMMMPTSTVAASAPSSVNKSMPAMPAMPAMPQGMAPRGMMPPGMPGMPGMMPQGMAPRGMMPPGMMPPGMPGMMPQGMAPRGMMPPGMPGMMPQGMMPPGMPGMPPRN